MDFLGRGDELAVLEKEYQRNSGFVVIYGRRRVGKTTLIKEFIKDKNALYFLATQEVEQAILGRFARKVSEFTQNPGIANARFGDWYDLFRMIADYKPDEKKVIVIDELPYIVKVNEAFPSILQYIWDEMLTDKNILLILCGSLISMMEKHTLQYESPLYGRRTAQIRLAPLSFNTVRGSSRFETAVERFSITGGVPKYLEIFGEGDIINAIDENILSKNGFLYEEPAFLLSEGIREPVTYYSIIEAIAKGDHKIGRIASVLGTPVTGLMPYIKTLIDLGFVEKALPVTESNAGKSKRGLYFIADNFMRFWFEYVFPFKGELEIENKKPVFEKLEKGFISNFAGFAYEDICKQIFTGLCLNGEIVFSPSKVGSYWANDNSGDMQIDVAAVDNSNKQVFFGECKYKNRPVDTDVYAVLKAKVESSKELNKVFSEYRFIYGVFSKSGFTDKLVEKAAQCGNLLLINEDNTMQLGIERTGFA